jgi:alpha/beta superfamily hydrolase
MPEVFFNGPAGRLEGRYTASTNPNAPIALVLHPHPIHGGTMNNKVVYNIYKSLVDNQFSVLRINFRGVGKSVGKFDNGIGELTDAATALDWIYNINPTASISAVAGFSFGALIALQLIMRRPEITHFIAVSPPVNKYDFSFLSPCPIPGLIIQGDKDSVVMEQSVSDLVSKLHKQKSTNIVYNMIPGADHFFRDKISELNTSIDDYLKKSFHHYEDGETGASKRSGDNDQDTQASKKKMFLI